MLIGLQNNTVITGAFAGGGGVCPMLAAQREGGRTSCVSFPEAWDRFTGVYGRQIIRSATQYEVGILRAQIQESLVTRTSDLAEAIADHHRTVEARRRRSRGASDAPLDLTGAIDEHKESARSRRSREATELGLDWLFEQTLVLPDGFGEEPQAESDEVDVEFDFDAAEQAFAAL